MNHDLCFIEDISQNFTFFVWIIFMRCWNSIKGPLRPHSLIVLIINTVHMAIAWNKSNQWVRFVGVCLVGGFHVASKHPLCWKFLLYKTGISATPACGEQHLVRAINITHYVQVWFKYMLSTQRLAKFIKWNLSNTQHDADWLGIITKLICNHCPKHKDLWCIGTIRAFPQSNWEFSIKIARR